MLSDIIFVYVFLAKYQVSCEEVRARNPTLASVRTIIDIDGSGYLEPFPVVCSQPREYSNIIQLILLYKNFCHSVQSVYCRIEN